MRISEHCEELIQALFCMEEQEGRRHFAAAEVEARAQLSGGGAVRESLEHGLAGESPEGLHLTERGRAAASDVVRRHRLAERLIYDVLKVSDEARESAACAFEHAVADEVTDSICTLLGHPRACPHGKPIPPGACCGAGWRHVAPVVERLADLRVGDSGTVAYIHTALEMRLDRLAAFGVMPGTPIHVHQTWPSFVVRLGETQLALDRETAEEIFVLGPGHIGQERNGGARARRSASHGLPPEGPESQRKTNEEETGGMSLLDVLTGWAKRGHRRTRRPKGPR